MHNNRNDYFVPYSSVNLLRLYKENICCVLICCASGKQVKSVFVGLDLTIIFALNSQTFRPEQTV